MNNGMAPLFHRQRGTHNGELGSRSQTATSMHGRVERLNDGAIERSNLPFEGSDKLAAAWRGVLQAIGPRRPDTICT